MVEMIKELTEALGAVAALGLAVGIGRPLLYVGWLALIRGRIG